MHRRNLLEWLHKYRSTHPDEVETADRFIDFVESEPRCFERDCWAGHITGSAWLVDPAGEALLLTHHKKLDMWVQLGGHSDGDSDTREDAPLHQHVGLARGGGHGQATGTDVGKRP